MGREPPVSRHATRHGTWWLPDRGDEIVNALMGGWLYQPEIIEVGLRYIRAGTQVLDVGANFGNMTIPFAQAAKGGIVHAFEADPFVARTLRQTVTENDANVLVHEGVVWHTSGLTLHFPEAMF